MEFLRAWEKNLVESGRPSPPLYLNLMGLVIFAAHSEQTSEKSDFDDRFGLRHHHEQLDQRFVCGIFQAHRTLKSDFALSKTNGEHGIMKISTVCLMQLAILLMPTLMRGDENPFQEWQTIGSLSNLSGALVDLDNDGDLDIYLSNYVGPSQVWFNNGQGDFTPGDFFGLSFTHEIAVADFDNDTSLDVFLPSNGIPTSLWFNDGTGQFTMSQQSMEQTAGEVGVGDLDGDGDMDLFLGWKTPIEDSVAFNDGNGVFSFPNDRTTSSAHPLAIGDLDSDGDLDAFVSRGSTVTPLGDLVLLNDGKGVFQLQNSTGLGSSYGTDVELADFDNDGDLDAFVANISVNGSQAADMIWINDGKGNFTDSGQMLGSEDSFDVAVADVDMDGDCDVMVLGSNRKQWLWLNDGNGVFSAPMVMSEYGDASQGLLGDVDGDGDDDAVIIAFDGTRVLMNNTVRKRTPDGMKLNDGSNVAGGLSDLFASDDQYFELDASATPNLRKQKIHLILQSTSPTVSPTDFKFRLESKMMGGPPGDVIQTIELLNYHTNQLEVVDRRAATNSDEVIQVTPTGDMSRFVQPITSEITAEVTWKSESFAGIPFTWSIDVDEAVWLISD